MDRTCRVTGKSFSVSDHEMRLRRKIGIEGEPDLHPVFRLQLLGAFWQHWNLHKRKCDKTGKQIISVFSENCPYPVWHKDEWIAHADPPSAEVDLAQPLFPQMWELFSRCPIAHNMGTGNENCEYADDMWYSKNCYLCHSGFKGEDLRYCYRFVNVRNCQFCCFAFDCENSLDIVNSHHCFRTLFALHCWNCSDSAFLYDCRNCQHCILCSNLRNKSYCIGNEQLSKEEFEKRAKEFDFHSRGIYEDARRRFLDMMLRRAWHRAQFMDLCERCTGDYLYECKDCTDCFSVTNKIEDCVNIMRSGIGVINGLDCVSLLGCEIAYLSSLAQDKCYDVRFVYNLVQCKYMEYCAQCFQCQNCFGCCGLVGKKYCIFNKQYTPEEYERKKTECVAAMKRTGEYGRFFPGHFAANPYEESIAGFHWPLSLEEGKRLGFRMKEEEEPRVMDALDPSKIPDLSGDATQEITKSVFWDDIAKRPFQIQAPDLAFSKDLGSPLPNSYYARRLQENFRLVPFTGELRKTACGKCKRQAETIWPKEYDGRILCEECYLKEVY